MGARGTARPPEATMLSVGALLLGFLVVCGATSLLPKQQQQQQRALLMAMDAPQTGSGNLIQQQQHQLSGGLSGGGAGRFATLINDANLDQQWFGGPSQLSKRARKMSAFMPMRGRKDGRDAEFLSDQASAYRENDAEPSIIRLVSAGSGAGDALHWLGPRQFASQLALRNQQPSLENVYELAGDQFSSGPQMMQAKLRRAFHPMRGKKSSNMEPLLSQAEALELADELGI